MAIGGHYNESGLKNTSVWLQAPSQSDDDVVSCSMEPGEARALLETPPALRTIDVGDMPEAAEVRRP
jgi:hypothetical protein